MRIIAGKYRGRKLPESRYLRDLRPTSDKNRENLFNILFSSKYLREIDFDLQNCDFLDVFSGSGAVAFEALSRGVKSATLIDKNREHINLSKSTAEKFGETNIQFFAYDLSKPLISAHQQFNLVFIDPPYNKNLAVIALQNLITAGWIAAGAVIVIEHFFAENLDDLPENLQLLEHRKYKETIFSFLRFTN